MKIIVAAGFFALSCVSYSQSSTDGFVINGKVPGINSGKIYLSAFTTGGRRDSALIENGTFKFTGSVNEPTPYILAFERNYVNKPLFNLFVENGTIKVDVNGEDIRKSKATGTPSQKEFAKYQEKIRETTGLLNTLYDRRRKTGKEDKATLESIAADIEKLAAKRKEQEMEFIQSNPKSVISAYIITRSYIYQPDLALLESLYEGLSPAVQTTSYARAIKDRIEKERLTAIGKQAIEFTQADTLGKMVSLKDFRGKYVLLDFWASWCGPCRAENPNVVKAFHAYKDKGFTVLGVSLDQPGKRQAWMDAIRKDNLTWSHVSDLKYWENEAARLYGINSVPSNFLRQ